MILVDTPIWSEALRRFKNPNVKIKNELTRLILSRFALLIGPVRQELLSGINDAKMFDRIRSELAAFQDCVLETPDYETAAEFFNRCRGKGVQGSNTDFLICAIAARRKYQIFTTDKDFENYSRILPIKLFRG